MSYDITINNLTDKKIYYKIENYKNITKELPLSNYINAGGIIKEDAGATIFNLFLNTSNSSHSTTALWQGAVPSNTKIDIVEDEKAKFQVYADDEVIPPQIINLKCGPEGCNYTNTIVISVVSIAVLIFLVYYFTRKSAKKLKLKRWLMRDKFIYRFINKS